MNMAIPSQHSSVPSTFSGTAPSTISGPHQFRAPSYSMRSSNRDHPWSYATGPPSTFPRPLPGIQSMQEGYTNPYANASFYLPKGNSGLSQALPQNVGGTSSTGRNPFSQSERDPPGTTSMSDFCNFQFDAQPDKVSNAFEARTSVDAPRVRSQVKERSASKCGPDCETCFKASDNQSAVSEDDQEPAGKPRSSKGTSVHFDLAAGSVKSRPVEPAQDEDTRSAAFGQSVTNAANEVSRSFSDSTVGPALSAYLKLTGLTLVKSSELESKKSELESKASDLERKMTKLEDQNDALSRALEEFVAKYASADTIAKQRRFENEALTAALDKMTSRASRLAFAVKLSRLSDTIPA